MRKSFAKQEFVFRSYAGTTPAKSGQRGSPKTPMTPARHRQQSNMAATSGKRRIDGYTHVSAKVYSTADSKQHAKRDLNQKVANLKSNRITHAEANSKCDSCEASSRSSVDKCQPAKRDIAKAIHVNYKTPDYYRLKVRQSIDDVARLKKRSEIVNKEFSMLKAMVDNS